MNKAQLYQITAFFNMFKKQDGQYCFSGQLRLKNVLARLLNSFSKLKTKANI